MKPENCEARREVQSSDRGNENVLQQVQEMFAQVRNLQQGFRGNDEDCGRTINDRLKDDIYSSCHDQSQGRGRPGGRQQGYNDGDGTGWPRQENDGPRRNNGSGDGERDGRPRNDNDRPRHQQSDRDNDRPRNSRDRNQRPESQEALEDRVDDATKYLNRNFDKLDVQNDGQVSRQEIDRALRHERDSDARRNLTTLRDNYDEIGRASNDRGDGLTRRDAREMHQDLEKNEQIRDFSSAMGEKGGALFHALDSSQNGQHDGKISKGDLAEFMRDSDPRNPRGRRDGVYSQENREVVQQMLDQWDNPDSAVHEMRDGQKYMTPSTVKNALRENQYRPDSDYDNSRDRARPRERNSQDEPYTPREPFEFPKTLNPFDLPKPPNPLDMLPNPLGLPKPPSPLDLLKGFSPEGFPKPPNPIDLLKGSSLEGFPKPPIPFKLSGALNPLDMLNVKNVGIDI